MVKNAAKEYGRLIYKASSKWANWDPPHPIRCGDYGVLNDSGQLEVEGNIYNASFKAHLPSHLDLSIPIHQPTDAAVEEKLIIVSDGATTKGIDVTPNIGITGAAQISLQVQLQFPQGEHGASLIMWNPRLTFIPSETIRQSLLDVPVLKDKYLVTKAFVCPAYSLYLSSKSGQQMIISLTVDTPIPAAPGVNVGGKASYNWKSSSQSQFLRQASSKEGEYAFTPLFELRVNLDQGKNTNPWSRMLRLTLQSPSPRYPDNRMDPPRLPPPRDINEDRPRSHSPRYRHDDSDRPRSRSPHYHDNRGRPRSRSPRSRWHSPHHRDLDRPRSRSPLYHDVRDRPRSRSPRSRSHSPHHRDLDRPRSESRSPLYRYREDRYRPR